MCLRVQVNNILESKLKGKEGRSHSTVCLWEGVQTGFLVIRKRIHFILWKFISTISSPTCISLYTLKNNSMNVLAVWFKNHGDLGQLLLNLSIRSDTDHAACSVCCVCGQKRYFSFPLLWHHDLMQLFFPVHVRSRRPLSLLLQAAFLNPFIPAPSFLSFLAFTHFSHLLSSSLLSFFLKH